MSRRLIYSPTDSTAWEKIEINKTNRLIKVIKERSEKANISVSKGHLPAFKAVVFRKGDLITIFNPPPPPSSQNPCYYLVFSHFSCKFANSQELSTLLVYGEDEYGDILDDLKSSHHFIGTTTEPNLAGVNTYTLLTGEDGTNGEIKWTINSDPTLSLSDWLSKFLYPKFKGSIEYFVKAELTRGDFEKTFGFNNPENRIAVFPAVFPCSYEDDRGRYHKDEACCTLIVAELDSNENPLKKEDFEVIVPTNAWRPNWPRTTGIKGLNKQLNNLFENLLKIFK